MQLQFLGTAAAEGWPGLFCNCHQCETARILGRRNIRTRSQAVLYADSVGTGDTDDILLIDFPPDTYMHVVQHGLRLDRIAHLIVTHSHNDHFDAKELSYRCGIYADPTPNFNLHIYGNEEVRQKYEDYVEYRDREKWPLGIEYHVVNNFEPFAAGNYTVTPLPALHDRSERCLIYMIEYDGKRILYGNDTGIFPDSVFDYIAGKPFDLITLDCTHCTIPQGTNHMGLPDAVEVKRRLSGIGCLKPDDGTKIILHHFSHHNGTYHDAMVKIAAEHKMDCSYDGGIWSV